MYTTELHDRFATATTNYSIAVAAHNLHRLKSKALRRIRSLLALLLFSIRPPIPLSSPLTPHAPTQLFHASLPPKVLTLPLIQQVHCLDTSMTLSASVPFSPPPPPLCRFLLHFVGTIPLEATRGLMGHCCFLCWCACIVHAQSIAVLSCVSSSDCHQSTPAEL